MELSEFFFDTPLYSQIIIDNDEKQSFFRTLIGLTNFNPVRRPASFDGFNPIKKKVSTFNINNIYSDFDKDTYEFQSGFITIEIKCKRYEDIFQFYVQWDSANNKMIKIGQYPSVADFHTSQVKQYAKLLKKEDMQEFTKAIGLAAHGIGIGSFVYLRRIFENLIQEAYQEALTDQAITEADFEQAHMDVKIQLLKTYLPEFLVEHKSMYSVLSLGIHSLDEQTCLAHFDTLRMGIELILDEKLEKQRKQDKISEYSKKLKALPNQVKSN